MYDKNKHIDKNDEFLNVFKEKLQEFEIPVAESNWDEIQARLATDKKRRVAIPFWRWMSGSVAAVVVLSLSLRLFISYNSQLEPIAQNAHVTKQTVVSKTNHAVDTDKKTNKQKKLNLPLVGKKYVFAGNERVDSDVSDTTEDAINTTTDIAFENPLDTLSIKTESELPDNSLLAESKQEQPLTPKSGIDEVKDWIGEKDLLKDKNDWYLALSTGTTQQNQPVSIENSFTARTMEMGFMGVRARNTTIMSPEDFENKHFYMPLSFSVLAGKQFNKIWRVETGLKYTNLYSTFSDVNVDAEYTLHYLGIPVNLNLYFLQMGNFNAYAAAGVTVEKGLRSLFVQHQYRQETQVITTSAEGSIAGVQVSLNTALGASYTINKIIELYAEPELSYFFANNQPISIRTANPVVIGLNVGCKIQL